MRATYTIIYNTYIHVSLLYFLYKSTYIHACKKWIWQAVYVSCIAGILGEENILANLGLPDVIVCMFIISIKTNNELEHYSANPQLVT